MVSRYERARAKRIIAEIVRQADGVFHNKTNLYKAFWKAHLNFTAANHGYLSAWPIVRMPNGPGIHQFDVLLGELLREGILHVEEVQKGDVEGFVFTLTEDGFKMNLLNENERQAIRDAVNEVRSKTAKQASDDSHLESRSWRRAKDGEELNIYVDLLSDDELSRSDERMTELADEVRRLWG